MNLLSFVFLTRGDMTSRGSLLFCGDMTMLLISLCALVAVIFEFFMPRFIMTVYGDIFGYYVSKLLTYDYLSYSF